MKGAVTYLKQSTVPHDCQRPLELILAHLITCPRRRRPSRLSDPPIPTQGMGTRGAGALRPPLMRPTDPNVDLRLG